LASGSSSGVEFCIGIEEHYSSTWLKKTLGARTQAIAQARISVLSNSKKYDILAYRFLFTGPAVIIEGSNRSNPKSGNDFSFQAGVSIYIMSR
jgi:hypothetical protein